MRKYRIIMILCVMSLFLVACTNKNDKTKVKMEETQEMETAAVLEPDLAQIRSICDLATLECYYHNVAKSTKEKGSGLAHLGEKERKFWIEYTGVVKIGIEMSDVKMDVNGTSVQITIPRAKIFQPEVKTIDVDDYIATSDSWFNKNQITAEEQTQAVNEAQDEMVAAVEKNKTLLAGAQERAKTLIENYMYIDSLIFFISDDVDMRGDHYHWRKTYPYEGSTHVPYIVKWPSANHVTPGKTDAPVELRDILPTFLDAADVTIPTDMDGRSLLPLAKGMETNWRKYLDLEHATCYSDDNYWCALTDGKIKYIWRIHTGTEELFDLTQDPQELHNAVNDKKYRKQLTEMRNEFIRHLSERGEEFVKDGRLVVKEKTMLYGPHYPEKENKR